MKILAAIVIPPHLSASGAVNAAIQLSVALADQCDIDIALMASSNEQQKLGRAQLLKRASSNIFSFTRAFLPDRFRTLFYRSDIPNLVQQGKYDLVHIHNPIPALEMQRIAQASISKGIPYVISTHGFVEVLAKERAYSLNWLEKIAGSLLLDRPLRKVIDQATKIFGLSPSDVILLSALGIPESKICVVPNGVNEFYYQQPTVEELETTQHKFGLIPLNPDTPVCFFLANHTKNKGLDVLLDAFLLTERPYWLIVGGKKRAYQYETYASRCRANQRMIFTDQLTNQEIRALLHISDLFVFPTLADTMPLVILEAMASGKPILSTKIGGIPYQVGEGCGLLVEPGNPLALKNGFELLTNDMSQLRQMGEQAQQNVQNRFDWKRSAQLAAEQYEAILRPQ